MALSPCPECRSPNVYKAKKTIGSGGGYAPNLLVGLGTWRKPPKVTVVVCADCGLIRQFAEREALRRLRDSDKWERT